jgi:diguanylate cyclase (GGDEF)-like protein/PAS domain S-box-containing protein
LLFQQRLLNLLPVARDSAIEIMSDGYLVLDSHNYILDLNKTMQSIMGLSAREAIGIQLPDTIARQLRPDDKHATKDEIDLNINGELRYYRVHYSPLSRSHKKSEGSILLFYDITQSKRFEQKLTDIATHDHLTGLPNRVLLEDRFDVALARARRNNKRFAVMICDLDYFKNVNDSMGHMAADKLLRAIAARLNRIMRGGDTLARAGGDEFVIILSEISTEKEAANVAARITKAFEKPFTVEDEEIIMSASIGIAIYPDNGEKIGILLRNADAAMYQIKNSGGANFMMYNEQKPAI